MFRIASKAEARTVIQIDGDLDASGAAELVKACRNATAPITLDLKELHTATDAGVEAVCALRAQGAEIQNASRYITLLLGDQR